MLLPTTNDRRKISARSLYEQPFPLQQGALDWLCSAYAAANLLFLKGEIDGSVDCSIKFNEAFKRLLTPTKAVGADGTRAGYGFAALAYLTEGIWPEDLSSVFEAFRLRISKPFSAPSADALAALIAESEAAIIYIISTDGRKGMGDRVTADFSHYTLVTKVSGSHLNLFDSFGLGTIERADNRFWLRGFEVEIHQAWTAQFIGWLE